MPYDNEGRIFEIHHIDGNRKNNHFSNLEALSINDHYERHYSQGDWAACLIMSERMSVSPEEKKSLARLANKGIKNPSYGKFWWTDGKTEMKQSYSPGPNWFRGRAPKSKAFMSESRKGLGLGPNPKRGRSGEKNAFSGKTHSQETKEHLRKMTALNSKTRGKFWWTDGRISVLDYKCPEGWRRGMGEDMKSKMQNSKRS